MSGPVAQAALTTMTSDEQSYLKNIFQACLTYDDGVQMPTMRNTVENITRQETTLKV